MSSIIKFTPILGGACKPGEVIQGPMAYVLEIDESVLLMDCGWDDHFDVSTIEALVEWVPRITCVLLSHADVYHLGALPYLVGKHGLKVPVYATLPVAKMGEMFLYDLHQSRKDLEDFSAFSLDDVDAAFALVERLRYSQRIQIPGTYGIEVTPFSSGHTVGGSVWKIQKETEEIVYAVDFNHKKERHLNGTALENLKRPTILITDAMNALTAQAPLRDRNQALLDSISAAIQSGGNVLLPVDTAGRVLEVLLCLEQQWSPQRGTIPVVFLTHVSSTTSEFARSQLEWMSDTVIKMYDYQKVNAFQFKYVNARQSLRDLESLPSPKIVLASSQSLDCGMAQALFLQWASNPRNVLIFTDRGYAGSLAHKLQAAASEVDRQHMIQMVVRKRVPLAGEELAQYWEEKNRRAQEERDSFAQGTGADFVAEDATAMHEMMDVVFEEDGPRPAQPGSRVDDVVSSLRAHFTNQGHDWILDRGARQHLARSSLFQNAPMFPYAFKRRRFDVWGEQVDLEALMEAATTQTPSGGPAAADASSSTAAKAAANEAAMDEEPATDAEDEIPTKCIVEEVNVGVYCSIKYIDFEGRSDGRSMKQILNHIAPRKVVLVHGSAEAVDHLREHCETALANVCQSVHQPPTGSTVDITIDTNILKVRVKESLNQLIHYVPVGNYEVSYVSGIIRSGNDLVQLEPLRQAAPHDAVYVGDLRLAEFRDELARSGYRTELMAGVLTVNDSLEIKKELVGSHARVVVNGLFSEDYFNLKDLLEAKFTRL